MSKTSKKNISRKYRLKRKTLKRRYSTKKQYRASSQRGGISFLPSFPGLSNPFSTKQPSSSSEATGNAVGTAVAFVKNTIETAADRVKYEKGVTFDHTLGKSDDDRILVGTGSYNDRKIKYNPKENTLKYFELDSGVLKGTINLNINRILSYKFIGKRTRGWNDKRDGLLIKFYDYKDLYLWANDINLLIKLCEQLDMKHIINKIKEINTTVYTDDKIKQLLTELKKNHEKNKILKSDIECLCILLNNELSKYTQPTQNCPSLNIVKQPQTHQYVQQAPPQAYASAPPQAYSSAPPQAYASAPPQGVYPPQAPQFQRM